MLRDCGATDCCFLSGAEPVRRVAKQRDMHAPRVTPKSDRFYDERPTHRALRPRRARAEQRRDGDESRSRCSQSRPTTIRREAILAVLPNGRAIVTRHPVSSKALRVGSASHFVCAGGPTRCEEGGACLGGLGRLHRRQGKQETKMLARGRVGTRQSADSTPCDLKRSLANLKKCKPSVDTSPLKTSSSTACQCRLSRVAETRHGGEQAVSGERGLA